MLRPLIAVTCLLALSACGGGKKPTGNLAAAAEFSYGTAAPAGIDQTAAVEGSVAGATAFAAAASAEGGLAIANVGLLTEALLGQGAYTLGVAARPPAQAALVAGGPRRALTASGFDNPACIETSATSVVLTRCTMTMDEVSPEGTFHLVVTASGTVAYAAATRTLSWNLVVGESMQVTGTQSGSASGSVHMAGSLAVTETTIVGDMATEIRLTASANGQSMSMGMDESVELDLTYADAATCATRITGGTVEAKRVWTARPPGATAADLPDAAAKVTWTGCGAATIQLGTH